MAAERGEKEARKQKKSESAGDYQADSQDDVEPNFSDPEDYTEDISDDGCSSSSFPKLCQYGPMLPAFYTCLFQPSMFPLVTDC